MQFVERSIFGVRSVVWRLHHPSNETTIYLFPMVHVAPFRFYSDISSRLTACDVILFEGVQSKHVGRLAWTYKQLTKNPRLDFVSQKEMSLEHVKDRLVHADMQGRDFDRKWRELTFFERWAVPVASVFYGLYLRFFGSKKLVAKVLNVDSLSDREKALSDDFEDVEHLITDQRDAVLCECIDQTLKTASGSACVGILYGAAHMPTISQYLIRKHGYKPVNGEWIPIFEFD